jgi:hypothetical protein
VQFNGFSLRALFGVADGVFIGGPFSPITGIDIAVDSQIATVTKTETGNAAVNFAAPSFAASGGRGSASIAGSAIANPDGHALGTIVFEITFAFTNLTGVDLDFLAIVTDFSAFNPGGPGIGARVDNSLLEFARFSSSQSGGRIGDSHQCDTRAPGPGGFTFPTTSPAAACGVNSPDSSQGEFGFSDLDQNETVTETFILRLTLEAQSISEPAALALFGAALAGLAAFGTYKRRT